MITYNNETRQKWFKEIKPQLIKKNPAINLPYLVDGDQLISETDAICIHLVHKANRPDLLGKNPQEQVLLATVMGVVKDLHTRYINYAYILDG